MPPNDNSVLQPNAGLEPYSHPLKDEQIDHLSTMLADDRCIFPEDLMPPDRARLLESLRRLLRRRLIQRIACAIAQELHRAVDSPRETPNHA